MGLGLSLIRFVAIFPFPLVGAPNTPAEKNLHLHRLAYCWHGLPCVPEAALTAAVHPSVSRVAWKPAAEITINPHYVLGFYYLEALLCSSPKANTSYIAAINWLGLVLTVMFPARHGRRGTTFVFKRKTQTKNKRSKDMHRSRHGTESSGTE